MKPKSTNSSSESEAFIYQLRNSYGTILYNISKFHEIKFYFGLVDNITTELENFIVIASNIENLNESLFEANCERLRNLLSSLREEAVLLHDERNYVDGVSKFLLRLRGKYSQEGKREEYFLSIIRNIHLFIETLAKVYYQLTLNKNNSHSYLGVSDLFNPNNSDKPLVVSEINRVIQLVDEEEHLTPHVKRVINNYLKMVIEELEQKFPQWTLIFGRLKEIEIILVELKRLIFKICDKEGLDYAIETLRNALFILSKTSFYEGNRIYREILVKDSIDLVDI